MEIKKVVIDVLKPHDPSVLVYAEKIASLKGIDGVTITVTEIDEKTESVEITIEGSVLHFESIQRSIEKLGGSVHSVDMVSAGSKIVPPEHYDP